MQPSEFWELSPEEFWLEYDFRTAGSEAAKNATQDVDWDTARRLHKEKMSKHDRK
jgi:hypothetical protein